MLIGMIAADTGNHHRPAILYPSARAGLKAFLQAANLSGEQRVLLPAYVGWSSREGSGVFDPMRDLGLACEFYRMDEHLHIDVADLEHCFRRPGVKVLIVIHYFGHVDPAYEHAVALARKYGAWVLEDEAHALFTDVIGGAAGRLGDACIYSTHKMLPTHGGGVLRFNRSGLSLLDRIDVADQGSPPSPWEFDLLEIARQRSANAQLLIELLEPLSGEIEPLWPQFTDGQIPQTLPVLVRNVSRDQLYHLMNRAGFGVVSLYHTLIDEISPASFPASHYLARRLMNFPVHQDITADALRAMVAQLSICISMLHHSER